MYNAIWEKKKKNQLKCICLWSRLNTPLGGWQVTGGKEDGVPAASTHVTDAVPEHSAWLLHGTHVTQTQLPVPATQHPQAGYQT